MADARPELTAEEKARDLAGDLELCEKATPGPWSVDIENDPDMPAGVLCLSEEVWCEVYTGEAGRIAKCCDTEFGKRHLANADFIVASRIAWPAAIRRALKAEARVAKLAAKCKNLKEHWHRVEVARWAAERARWVSAKKVWEFEAKNRELATKLLDAEQARQKAEARIAELKERLERHEQAPTEKSTGPQAAAQPPACADEATQTL